jgi:hypothetical protein
VCFRTSNSLAGLIDDLRSLITTWEKSNSGDTNQFFTDRRYYSNRPNHSNHSNYHLRRPFLSFRNKDGNEDRKKRCFVCDKEGCWSSNHSKEEREESRKKFRAKFSQRFDRYTRQYIANYEVVDDDTDDLDSIDEAIKAPMIADTDTLPNKDDLDSAEHFTTSFGVLEPQRAFDITTDLANQSLTHALTCEDVTSDSTATVDPTVTTTNSDPSSYTTTSRYTAD